MRTVRKELRINQARPSVSSIRKNCLQMNIMQAIRMARYWHLKMRITEPPAIGAVGIQQRPIRRNPMSRHFQGAIRIYPVAIMEHTSNLQAWLAALQIMPGIIVSSTTTGPRRRHLFPRTAAGICPARVTGGTSWQIWVTGYPLPLKVSGQQVQQACLIICYQV